MKSLSIAEQMNACIKHANRNGLSIDNVNVYPQGKPNHQVIMDIGAKQYPKNGSIHFISVAILANIKNGTFHQPANESTWN